MALIWTKFGLGTRILPDWTKKDEAFEGAADEMALEAWTPQVDLTSLA